MQIMCHVRTQLETNGSASLEFHQKQERLKVEKRKAALRTPTLVRLSRKESTQKVHNHSEALCWRNATPPEECEQEAASHGAAP